MTSPRAQRGHHQPRGACTECGDPFTHRPGGKPQVTCSVACRRRRSQRLATERARAARIASDRPPGKPGRPPKVADVEEVPLPVWRVEGQDARMLALCVEHGVRDAARLLGVPQPRLRARLRLLIGGDTVPAISEAAMALGWLRLPDGGRSVVPCCRHRCGLDEPGRHGRPPEPFPHRPIALVPPAPAPAPSVRSVAAQERMALIAEAYVRNADPDRPAA